MIDSFIGDHRFLSNFYPVDVEYLGDLYPTLEHAYQAAKASKKSERTRIREAATPGEAKRMGKQITVRKDWDEVKLKVMYDLLLKKFSTPDLAILLLQTGDQLLCEGNTWGRYLLGKVRRRR